MRTLSYKEGLSVRMIKFSKPRKPKREEGTFGIGQRRCKYGSHRWLDQIGDSFSRELGYGHLHTLNNLTGGGDILVGVRKKSGGEVVTERSHVAEKAGYQTVDIFAGKNTILGLCNITA
jgi:hypothetical protein